MKKYAIAAGLYIAYLIQRKKKRIGVTPPRPTPVSYAVSVAPPVPTQMHGEEEAADHYHLWKDDSGAVRKTGPSIFIYKNGQAVDHIHSDYKEEVEGPKTSRAISPKTHIHLTSLNKKTGKGISY